MRTEKEIAHALDKIRSTLGSELAQNDPGYLRATAAIIQTLRWVQGSDQPGGFGEMLRVLDRIDLHERG